MNFHLPCFKNLRPFRYRMETPTVLKIRKSARGWMPVWAFPLSRWMPV